MSATAYPKSPIATVAMARLGAYSTSLVMTLSAEMFEQTLGSIFGQTLDEFKSMLNPVARAIQVSRLINIADWTGALRASVIFVHGLGGHAYH
jgi:hypothetical protein